MKKDVKKMTYKELENELISNRVILRSSTDMNEKRVIIRRNHDLMVEMDARWSK